MALLAARPAVPAGLEWVDPWVRAVRPILAARAEDGVLIRRPNQAIRVNRIGAAILEALLGGARIGDVLAPLAGDEEKVWQVCGFLHAARRFVEGRLEEDSAGVAVEPFALGFSDLPILSEVALTSRCNLRCAFCYAGCGSVCGPGRGPEMTTREVRIILGKIAREARVPSVSFTGGEPCLRADLPALVRHAKGLGLRVNLITNGTLATPRLARRLVRAGLSSAQVSLEGTTAATHDAITGVAGSFTATLAGVRALAVAGLSVHTNTTLNRRNLAEAALLPRFVKEVLGLPRLSMNLVIPAGSAGGRPELVVPYSEAGPVVLAVARAAEESGVEFLWYSPTPLCLFNPVAHGLGNKGCAACDGLLSVASDGSVLPCSSWDEPVGNLLREDARSVWRSARATAIREKRSAPEGCRDCADFALCQGACPLYFRVMGTAEIGGGR
jgi:radical SAM protein with 4Fe4S-binding SPASM domain